MWGVLSDERTGLSFAIATGPRQRSHSRVRVPWDSRPCFTVSDSRHPLSSPRTTRRVTVEVFDPYLLHVGLFLGLFFDPEDGDDMFLGNVVSLSTDCMALYPKNGTLSITY
jgi:hypothetical protein